MNWARLKAVESELEHISLNPRTQARCTDQASNEESTYYHIVNGSKGWEVSTTTNWVIRPFLLTHRKSSV